MPERTDMQTALAQLEEQLQFFGTARELLDNAQARNDQQLVQWKSLKDEQANERASLLKDFDNFFNDQTQKFLTLLQEQSKEREKLLDAVRQSQETASKLVTDLDSVVSGLQMMVKAVDEAGFPHRLENVQTMVTTSQAAIQSLQSRIDQLERHNEGQIKLLTSEMQKADTALQQELRSTSMDATKTLLERLDFVFSQVEGVINHQTVELQQTVVSAEQSCVHQMQKFQEQMENRVLGRLETAFADQTQQRKSFRNLVTVLLSLTLIGSISFVILHLFG